MLSIRNLSHVYPGGTRALDDVSLEIPAGMFGLLGPNGAGKSTLMRCIAALQTPTSGAIDFDGIDVLAEPSRLRQTLGYLPQDFGVYPRVSALDLLDHLAVLKAAGDGRGPAKPGQSLGGPQEGRRRLFRRHAPAFRHRPGPDRPAPTHHRGRAHRRPRS
jgi:ABC-type multidrug transport system ATPase subunit